MRSLRAYAFVALAATTCAVACGSAFPQPTYSPHKTEELVPVPYPPPPARVESVPDKPESDAVWIDGQWVWRGRKWAWRIGYWARVPSGATYSPWQLSRSEVDGSLYFAPGTWRTSNGQPAEPPVALRIAGARTQTVIDAEGIAEPTGVNLAPDGGRVPAGDAGR